MSQKYNDLAYAYSILIVFMDIISVITRKKINIQSKIHRMYMKFIWILLLFTIIFLFCYVTHNSLVRD